MSFSSKTLSIGFLMDVFVDFEFKSIISSKVFLDFDFFVPLRLGTVGSASVFSSISGPSVFFICFKIF